MKEFKYLAPRTLEEAIALKKEYGDAAKFIAGSTDVVVAMRDYKITPEYIIDLKKIPGMDQITWDEKSGLHIGALVTMDEISKSPLVLEHLPFLAKAAGSVGSRQVRSRATCVGNICNASPLADTATPLYAANAEVEIAGPNGTRVDKIVDFIQFIRKVDLGEGELVTGIRVPAQKLSGAFYKIARRRQVDLSTVCGTVAKGEDGYRIAMGSVAVTPLRLPKAEAILNGAKELTDEIIEQAAAMGQTEVSPIGDVRADKQYRLDMVAYIIRHGAKEIG